MARRSTRRSRVVGLGTAAPRSARGRACEHRPSTLHPTRRTWPGTRRRRLDRTAEPDPSRARPPARRLTTSARCHRPGRRAPAPAAHREAPLQPRRGAALRRAALSAAGALPRGAPRPARSDQDPVAARAKTSSTSSGAARNDASNAPTCAGFTVSAGRPATQLTAAAFRPSIVTASPNGCGTSNGRSSRANAASSAIRRGNSAAAAGRRATRTAAIGGNSTTSWNCPRAKPAPLTSRPGSSVEAISSRSAGTGVTGATLPVNRGCRTPFSTTPPTGRRAGPRRA